MHLPNERTTAIHVLSEEDDAEKGYQHKCSDTLLDVPLYAFHHVTTNSRHKTIFVVYAIIIYDDAVATAFTRRR